jgi:hypothetical protein
MRPGLRRVHPVSRDHVVVHVSMLPLLPISLTFGHAASIVHRRGLTLMGRDSLLATSFVPTLGLQAAPVAEGSGHE